MFVKGSDDVFGGLSFGFRPGFAAGDGQDREGPLGVEGRLLLGHVQQVRKA
jgi:hypothetical protein